MVTLGRLLERLAECGYDKPKPECLESVARGHALVIVERKPIYVGAFSKDCKTVAEQYPDHVSIE
jgi:hypothetical protein